MLAICLNVSADIIALGLGRWARDQAYSRNTNFSWSTDFSATSTMQTVRLKIYASIIAFGAIRATAVLVMTSFLDSLRGVSCGMGLFVCISLFALGLWWMLNNQFVVLLTQ